MHEVTKSSMGDLAHMLVWGGVGTPMDADIKELLVEAATWLSCKIVINTEVWDGGEASNVKETTPRISKVPQSMTLKYGLDNPFRRWNEPSVISIGPYHYDYGNLAKAQKLKVKYAKRFIANSGQIMEQLYCKIEKKIKELRTWYNNQAIAGMRDSKLATIFLLDGCFLLDFINYIWDEDVLAYSDFTTGEITNMKQDLFLLENQLPYEVLNLLFQGAKKPSSQGMKIRIKYFVASHSPISGGIWDTQVDPSRCFHLLHYLSDALSQKHMSPLQRHEGDGGRHGKPGTNWGSCRTVQELMEVGIHFKPSSTSYLTDKPFKPTDFIPTIKMPCGRNDEPSPTSYLTDISYKPGYFCTSAHLQLPTITISTSTMITFLNLIAFESSHDNDGLGVISYLCFMDSLIDCEADVKELQVAGILRNYVGEPKDVAQFFNTVCRDLVPNPSTYREEILDIKRHAVRHYNSRWRMWLVQCKQIYFSSPWSCIALLAASIGLSLTAIQAFTSVFPQ